MCNVEMEGNDMARIGIVGLGRAAATLLPSMIAHPGFEIVALAEPNSELRLAFCEDFPVRAYEDAHDLFADDFVDVVYVATPHQYHRDHVLGAIAHGKHVLVEKPMALTLQECDEMIGAAQQAGVVLLVGHTNGYDAPILALREIAASQRFGALRMLNTFNYTDFLYRPRRPEELDTAHGGGIMYNQFPHQVDVLRTIADAPVTTISATCGSWDSARPTEAAIAAFMRFEDGVVASAVYSGYAHLLSDAFSIGLDHPGETRASLREPLLGLSPQQEAQAKAESGYLARRRDLTTPPVPASRHERFGVLVAGFEGADIVTSPTGLTVYGDGSIEEIAVPFGGGGGRRATVFDELAAALAGRSPIHDGTWGRATLAVCLAAMESSASGREVVLIA